MIIVGTQVAEPHVAEIGGGMFGQGHGTLRIAQMPYRSGYTLLEVLRITTLCQHLFVVVGLDHEIVALFDDLKHLIGQMSDIGHQTEHNTFTLYLIAHIVGTIVGDTERRHMKFAQCKRSGLFYNMYKSGVDFLPYTIVAFDALMHFAGGEDWQPKVTTDAPHRLDMVGMVMGNQYVMHAI